MIISAADAARVIDLSPADVAARIEQGRAVLVDVREPEEFGRERIDGAVHAPLSCFDPVALRSEHGPSTLVFQCRVGQRSVAAALLYGEPDEPLFHLAGGIEAWKRAGLPVVRRGESPP